MFITQTLHLDVIVPWFWFWWQQNTREILGKKRTYFISLQKNIRIRKGMSTSYIIRISTYKYTYIYY